MSKVLNWIALYVLIVLGSMLIARGVSGGSLDELGQGEALLLLACCCLFCGAVALLPHSTYSSASLSRILQPAIISLTACLTLLLWYAPDDQWFPSSFKIAPGVALIIFSLTAIVTLLERMTGERRTAAWWTISVGLLIATAPLWAGPLVEVWPYEHNAVNATIAVSPLSYLATLAEWDYLRGEWFYRWTPFGGLRYDYPNPITSSLAYFGLGLLSHFLSRIYTARNSRSNNLPSP